MSSRRIVTLITTLALFLWTGLVFANPFLIAEPLGNETTYYVISINNEEFTVPASDEYNWNLFYSLGILKLGDNIVFIQAGNEKGESPKIDFIVNVWENKIWRVFTVVPDKQKIRNNPWYAERFEKELTVRIRK